MYISGKVLFSNPRAVAATGKYPAKTMITITDISGRGGQYQLASEKVDLTTLPLMELCDFEAEVSRMGGAKGFFVLQVEQLSCKPVIPAAKK
jgi:hypothetical protein